MEMIYMVLSLVIISGASLLFLVQVVNAEEQVPVKQEKHDEQIHRL